MEIGASGGYSSEGPDPTGSRCTYSAPTKLETRESIAVFNQGAVMISGELVTSSIAEAKFVREGHHQILATWRSCFVCSWGTASSDYLKEASSSRSMGDLNPSMKDRVESSMENSIPLLIKVRVPSYGCGRGWDTQGTSRERTNNGY